MKKVFVIVSFLMISSSIYGVTYVNETLKTLIITNTETEDSMTVAPGETVELQNAPKEMVTIAIVGSNDMKKLYPTNNSFNYVVTYNNFSDKYEKLTVNYAQ